MKKYFAIRVEMCPLCDGYQTVPHPQWDEFYSANGAGPDNERNCSEWFRTIEQWFLGVNGTGKYGRAIIPPEDITCPKCDGEGVIRTQFEISKELGDEIYRSHQ